MSRQVFIVLVGLILITALQIISSRLFYNIKYDGTAEKLYTLSEGTKTVLGNLEEPVTLTLYYSSVIGQTIPQYGALAKRVENLLRQYEQQGNIEFNVIHPEPFSKEEDKALAAGLKNAKITADGDAVYFGLVGTNSVGDTNLVPFFSIDRENFLEYDLTKFIADLNETEKPSIALISTVDMTGINPYFGRNGKPWVIYQQLQQFFAVNDLGKTANNIPDGIETLVLVQPMGLPEETLYAIDQFLVKGGKAMVFYDPLFEGAPPSSNKPEKTTATIDDILKNGGITISKEFVADYQYARRVAVQEDQYQRQSSYLAWPLFTQQAFNATAPIMAQLKAIGMATVGAITIDNNSESSALITSSMQSGLLPIAVLKPTPRPEKLLQAFTETPETYTIAATVTRKVNSAFDVSNADHIKEGSKPASIIVVADVDMLTNQMWVQVGNFMGQQITIPNANNGAFVLNALESLTGNSALSALRSRAATTRPFTKIIALQKEAEATFRIQEEAIARDLQKSQAQLDALLTGAGDLGKDQQLDQQEGQILLTEEQQKLVEEQQIQVLNLRQSLRNVQRSLRKNVENLRYKLLFLNIGFIPLLVAGFAIWAVRRRWQLFY